MMWVNQSLSHEEKHIAPVILCPLSIPLNLTTPNVSSSKWQIFVISGSWILFKLHYKEDENKKNIFEIFLGFEWSRMPII